MKSPILFYDRKMVIQTKDGYATHYYGELMYVLFDKPDCLLHFTENAKYRVEVTLQHIMDNLPKATFIKCKRSAIVNLCYHKSFIKTSREIIMDNSEIIKVSKQNVNDIYIAIKNLPIISPPNTHCYSCQNNECNTKILFSRGNEQ